MVEIRDGRGNVLKRRLAWYNGRRGREEIEMLERKLEGEIGRAVMKSSWRKMNQTFSFPSHLQNNRDSKKAVQLIPHHRVWRSNTGVSSTWVVWVA